MLFKSGCLPEISEDKAIRPGIRAMPAVWRKKRSRLKQGQLRVAFNRLFDDVSIQCSKDIVNIAVSMYVEVNRLGKIQAEDSHD